MNIRRDGTLILGGKRSLVEAEETDMWTGSAGADTGGIHDEGSGDPRIVSALKEWLKRTFPALGAAAHFTHSWKGLIAITKDGMPLVGPLPGSNREGVIVCGGLGGHGMPRCYGLGEAVARMLVGRKEEEQYSRDYLKLCSVTDRFLTGPLRHKSR
jgi:glycine/D-amino acid oxidase-like deaminating enzyme